MGRIVLNWIFSVISGSIIGGVLFGKTDNGAVILISIVLAGLSSIPLVVTEIIACVVLRKKMNERFDFMRFSIVKYVVVFITLLVVQIASSNEFGSSLEDSYPSLLVFGLWGVPGLIFHFVFLRPGLINYQSPIAKKVINQDVLDGEL